MSEVILPLFLCVSSTCELQQMQALPSLLFLLPSTSSLVLYSLLLTLTSFFCSCLYLSLSFSSNPYLPPLLGIQYTRFLKAFKGSRFFQHWQSATFACVLCSLHKWMGEVLVMLSSKLCHLSGCAGPSNTIIWG